MTKTDLANGISLVEIPGAGLSILCGCPENAVKFLIKRGLIREIERDGVRFETGPNAILLSELPIQNGRFRNLGEFPVLQMLYRQGMIIPGHPNNRGIRPMIIGLEDQVEAQSRYIYAGNYGLSSARELERAGLTGEEAREFFRMKLWFAFGSIRKTEELLDLRVFRGHAIELRGGAFIRRTGVNRYEFFHAGESVEVDLNPGPPGPGGRELPYALPRGTVARDYFSIVHLGEGDGWDSERPCMASLVVFRGVCYLVDAGPDIDASLEAMGIGVGDLGGIFHTHAHDDHFVGLTTLLHSERRLKYFAAPWVRASVEAKLLALAGMDGREFRRYFEVHDLEVGAWNNFGGLEVFPSMSPHPVETTILRFRARGATGYRSYAHLADLASFAVLDSMVAEDAAKPGISAELAARTKAAYLESADVKKVDAGAGMIHGNAKDFADDESGHILLSHNFAGASLLGGGRTRIAAFGDQDRLIVVGAGRADDFVTRLPYSPGERLDELEELVTLLAWVEPFSEIVRPGARSPARSGTAPGGKERRREVAADTLAQIAAASRLERMAAGSSLLAGGEAAIRLVARGRARIFAAGRIIGLLGPGEVFGEEGLQAQGPRFFDAVAIDPVEVYIVPMEAIAQRPLLLWRFREKFEGRMAELKSAFDFAWQPSFSVADETLDAQHRRLFSIIGRLEAKLSRAESCPDAPSIVEELNDFAREHFRTEEKFMLSGGYPGLDAHAKRHAAIIRELGVFGSTLDCDDRGALVALDGFLRDWALRHTLLLDRQYMPFLPGALASPFSPR